jgi:hypothetical protein
MRHNGNLSTKVRGLQVGPQEGVAGAQVPDVPLDRGVIAQEPHWRVLIGSELGERDQVTDTSLDGEVCEAPLLRLGAL